MAESRFPVGSSASRIDRIAAQRARHGHALLLTARELRRIVLHAVRHAHPLERFLHALLALGRAHAAIGQRQFDVLVHRKVADQVERLEDKADLPVADAGALGELQPAHRPAVQRVGAVAGSIQQAQNGQQGGLAAARRAGDREVLALLQIELDAGQGVRLDLVGHEHFGHAVQANQRFSSVRTHFISITFETAGFSSIFFSSYALVLIPCGHIGQDHPVADVQPAAHLDGVHRRAAERDLHAIGVFAIRLDLEQADLGVRLAEYRPAHEHHIVELFQLYGSVHAQIGPQHALWQRIGILPA